MKNKIVLIFGLLLLTTTVFAQQEPFYSIFWNNPSTYNPATTGEQSKYFGAINYRNQWENIRTKGNPWDISALFELRLDSINSAFGVNYRYEQLGLEKSNHVGFNYSYHINLRGDRKIGIGISPTLMTKKFDIYRFAAIDDPPQDSSIPQEKRKLSFFDVNTGVSYLSKRFRAGIGVTKILETKDLIGDRAYQNQRHLFTNISYDFLMQGNFKLIPQFRFATDFSSRIYEASLIAKYKNRYWIGGSYRSEVAFGILAGIDIAEKVRFGYAFDYYRNNTIDFNFGGAHEIVFAIMLN